MLKKQQQDYQRSRDPFQYGQQVAKRRYSEIMSGLQNQQANVQQSYGDLYQAANQRAVKNQAIGIPSLSGGMAQQGRDFASAAEIQQMGQISSQADAAQRDLFAQGQAAFSNAQLEGQQATQTELQNQQTQLQLVQQRQAILSNPDLTEEQRAEQLRVFGANPQVVEEKQKTWDQWLATGAIGLGTGAVAIAGIAKLAGVVKASAALRTAYMTATVASRAMGSAPLLSVFSKVAPAGKLALAGVGKVGSLVATSMAAHPVGWAIGAIVVGSLLVAGVAGAISASNRNNNTQTDNF